MFLSSRREFKPRQTDSDETAIGKSEVKKFSDKKKLNKSDANERDLGRNRRVI